MPLYTFDLSDGSSPICDDVGVYLPDREHALAYVKDVARELRQGREVETRTWRLRIYENHVECGFEITFATLDRTLDHLVPELRHRVVRMCDNYRDAGARPHSQQRVLGT
jgi:hypothetical protein